MIQPNSTSKLKVTGGVGTRETGCVFRGTRETIINRYSKGRCYRWRYDRRLKKRARFLFLVRISWGESRRTQAGAIEFACAPCPPQTSSSNPPRSARYYPSVRRRHCTERRVHRSVWSTPRSGSPGLSKAGIILMQVGSRVGLLLRADAKPSSGYLRGTHSCRDCATAYLVLAGSKRLRDYHHVESGSCFSLTLASTMHHTTLLVLPRPPAFRSCSKKRMHPYKIT